MLAMVAPMLMHNYTDATAAGQPLIAAQFAVVLQVVWRAIWQFLDAILLGALVARNRVALPPRSSPPLPPVAVARRGGSSGGRRQMPRG